MDVNYIFKFFHHIVADVDRCLLQPAIAKECDLLWVWFDATLMASVIVICISIMKFIIHQKSQYIQCLCKCEERDRLIRHGLVHEGDSINGIPLDEAKALIRDILEAKKD